MSGTRILTCVVLLQSAICNLQSAIAADPSAAPDVQDVVFYGKTRPVLIRLHILVDGKPYSQAWDNYIKARFDYADRDGNGSLDRDEVRMIPSAQVFQQMLQGAGFFYNGTPARFEELDGDGDG